MPKTPLSALRSWEGGHCKGHAIFLQIDGPGICLPCHVNEKSSSFRSTQPQNKADTILLKACVTKILDLPYPVFSRYQETM